jgi:hypothetical protein
LLNRSFRTAQATPPRAITAVTKLEAAVTAAAVVAAAVAAAATVTKMTPRKT